MEYVMEARQSQFFRESFGELAINLDTHSILYLNTFYILRCLLSQKNYSLNLVMWIILSIVRIIKNDPLNFMLPDAQIREKKKETFLLLISTHLTNFKWTSHKLQQPELNYKNMFPVYEEENCCQNYLTL